MAPVADRRVITFPDSLPLHVEDPLGALTAQPRNLPERVSERLEKALGSLEGLEVVRTGELPPAPSAEVVRAVAGRLGLDAVFAGAVTAGFGQMQALAFRRRIYTGRVQVALQVLSGRTGRELTPGLALEGYDEIEVNFRRRLDFETLHHRGAGPEIRERMEWAVRDLGEQLKEKISAQWLAAVVAEDDRPLDTEARAELHIQRVAVEPGEPRLGQTALMMIVYELRGLEPGDAVPVTETRRLIKDGSLVGGPFQVVHHLGNGRHTSSQELHIPGTVEPGRYTIIGSVEAAGAHAGGSGSFELRGP